MLPGLGFVNVGEDYIGIGTIGVINAIENGRRAACYCIVVDGSPRHVVKQC